MSFKSEGGRIMTNMNKSTTIERQKRIVEILTLLHEGGMFEDAKKNFLMKNLMV